MMCVLAPVFLERVGQALIGTKRANITLFIKIHSIFLMYAC